MRYLTRERYIEDTQEDIRLTSQSLRLKVIYAVEALELYIKVYGSGRANMGLLETLIELNLLCALELAEEYLEDFCELIESIYANEGPDSYTVDNIKLLTSVLPVVSNMQDSCASFFKEGVYELKLKDFFIKSKPRRQRILKKEVVVEIRKLHLEGYSLKEISKKIGIRHNALSDYVGSVW